MAGHAWPYMAIYGRPYTAINDHIRPDMPRYGARAALAREHNLRVIIDAMLAREHNLCVRVDATLARERKRARAHAREGHINTRAAANKVCKRKEGGVLVQIARGRNSSMTPPGAG